jgi:histidinol-phosphate aminotransferase
MMNNIIRRDLLNFSGYSSARMEAQTGTLWLDANESPWETELNRYPEPQPRELLARCAEFYEVQPENILLTRGSDEAIDLLVRLCCEPGHDNILICPPTYGMYTVAASLQGAGCISMPLLAYNGFAYDIPGIVKASTDNVKLLFLCSPNNPTGNVVDEKQLMDLAETINPNVLIVIDEAYIEFSSAKSAVRLVTMYPNLVILRTFSKAFGLAGARCGALITNPSLIQCIRKVSAPYPLPSPTIRAVNQALSANNLREVMGRISLIKQNRERLADFLKQCAWVSKVYPSEANYLLVECKNGQVIYDSCLAAGIVLRNMGSKLNLVNCLRITIGTNEQMNTLMTLLVCL